MVPVASLGRDDPASDGDRDRLGDAVDHSSRRGGADDRRDSAADPAGPDGRQHQAVRRVACQAGSLLAPARPTESVHGAERPVQPPRRRLPDGHLPLERRRDYDLSGHLAADDKIISALPDWDGRIWFATRDGVVGWVNRHSGKAHTRGLGAPIGNSFAVDELRGVYIVTDAALYRLTAEDGRVRVVWRHGYPNDGTVKPGQTQAGSGTTPTITGGGRYVAITDNADPVHIMVFKRAARPRGRRVV